MQGQNFLNPIEFQFEIKRLPNVEFYVQNVVIPDISSGVTTQTTPFKNIYRPGDKVDFGDLVVTCALDENMESFKEVWNWLIALTYPNGFDQYKGVEQGEDGVYSDASLIIMNSSKNPNIEIKFKDIFPISVGSVSLDTTDTDVNAPKVDFTFRYSTYEFV